MNFYKILLILILIGFSQVKLWAVFGMGSCEEVSQGQRETIAIGLYELNFNNFKPITDFRPYYKSPDGSKLYVDSKTYTSEVKKPTELNGRAIHDTISNWHDFVSSELERTGLSENYEDLIAQTDALIITYIKPALVKPDKNTYISIIRLDGKINAISIGKVEEGIENKLKIVAIITNPKNLGQSKPRGAGALAVSELIRIVKDKENIKIVVSEAETIPSAKINNGLGFKFIRNIF